VPTLGFVSMDYKHVLFVFVHAEQPIRTIVASLDEITNGAAAFGASLETTCVCVDDDIYPYKVKYMRVCVHAL